MNLFRVSCFGFHVSNAHETTSPFQRLTPEIRHQVVDLHVSPFRRLPKFVGELNPASPGTEIPHHDSEKMRHELKKTTSFLLAHPPLRGGWARRNVHFLSRLSARSSFHRDKLGGDGSCVHTTSSDGHINQSSAVQLVIG